MGNIRKRGQTISLDVYIGVAIFLVTFVLFFGFIAKKTIEKDIYTETRDVSDKVMADSYFKDQYITPSEETAITDMSCDDLKEKYGTRKNVCIYFSDVQGNVAPINFLKYGIGCPGINISGVPCGEYIKYNDLILQSQLIIYNSERIPTPVAFFLNSGKISITGNCYNITTATTTECPTDEESIAFSINDTIEMVLEITNTGNLCFKSGNCSVIDANCDISADYSVVIQNDIGNNVSYLGGDGRICHMDNIDEKI